MAERQRLHDWERAAACHTVLQQRLGGVELAALAEKAAAGVMEKAVAGRSSG
jgi:hypothetical protein